MTDVVAVLGAFTGCLALLLALLQFRRDRVRIRTTTSIGRIGQADAWSELMVFVEAVNTGRRPVEIAGSGFEMDHGDQSLQLTGNPGHYTLPALLQEGSSHKSWAPLEGLARQVVALNAGLPRRAYYFDSAGGRHKTPVPRTMRQKIKAAADALADAREGDS